MKNVDNVETVDKSRHSKLRVKQNPDLVHARNYNLVSVTLGELSACTCNYPVVFIRNPENQKFRMVAMFGLRPGENFYYGKDGWDSTYAPLMLQTHPFVIGFDDREEEGNKLATCLEMNSPFLSESEGIALYKENGDETDFLVTRHRMLFEIFESERKTEQFLQKLTELDLLMPFELILQPADAEPRKVTGMHTISERKLKALTAEQLQDLHQKDFLPACYIALGSLFQLHNLMKLRNRKNDEKVVNYRIELEPQRQAAQ